MSRIETMSRASAQSVLGLPANASPDEIRAVWKKRAFELHPDRGADTAKEFLAAKTAYAVLSNLAKGITSQDTANADAKPGPDGKQAVVQFRSGVRRVTAASCERIAEVTAEQKAACLDALGGQSTGLVARQIHQRGRNVSFVVDVAMDQESTLVAVPTGFLVDTRKIIPVVISVSRKDMLRGSFEVPDEICKARFPGARHVQIRFVYRAS